MANKKVKVVAEEDVKEVVGSSEQPIVEEVKEAKEIPTTKAVFESMDGKTLEVSINNEFWKGKRIMVDQRYADDVDRLLKTGGYLFVRS